MASKTKVREQLKQTRLSMSNAERTLKSREIVKRLEELVDWSKVGSIHYFEPIHGLLEVDIGGFITDLEDKYPSLKLIAPRLIKGEWQLVVAHNGSATPEFDVVIVPMLGFDPASLHRIGYGGGYYDQFLAAQPRARKIGICFEAGKTVKLPVEPHDVALDTIVTEAGVYSAK